jgi:hypothetical protein
MARGRAADQAHSRAVMTHDERHFTMDSLTITFAGICTHFRDVVRGVHRVVLPHTATFRFGLVQPAVEGVNGPQAYYLQPHFGLLKFGTDGNGPSVANIMRSGYLYTPCRIEVLNSAGGLWYADRYLRDVPHLSDYVADFTYSKDVVTGERAICYFDVSNGTVDHALSKDAAHMVVITIPTTDTPPTLRFTPFDTNIAPQTLRLTTDTESMMLYNSELPPLEPEGVEDTPFDFLLHYETAQSGIPQKLVHAAPGMTSESLGRCTWNPTRLKNALTTLGDVMSGDNAGPSIAAIARVTPESLNPSCSNSQYP